LRFVETVRELDCVEDGGKFERLLTIIGSSQGNRPRFRLEAGSGMPMALGLVGPAASNRERATA
jgi:hypothetical protein